MVLRMYVHLDFAEKIGQNTPAKVVMVPCRQEFLSVRANVFACLSSIHFTTLM